MKALLLLLPFIMGCAHNDEWTKRDTILQLGITAVMISDAITTEKIQYHADVYEAGPIAKRFLGQQPTTSDTYMYFTTAIISSYFISRMMPAKWRPYYQGVQIAGHGWATYNNCRQGLCGRGK